MSALNEVQDNYSEEIVSPLDMENKKAGVRKDHALYKYIVDAYNASKEVIEKRGIYDKARKYTKMYENKSWEALKQRRAAHLTKFEIAIAFDAIETGVNIVTARIPRPDIQPSFDSNYEPYVALKQAYQQAEQSNDPEIQDIVQKSYEKLKEQVSDYTSKLQREMVQKWVKLKMQGKMRQLYREKAKTGTVLMKIVFDPAKKKINNTICDLTTIYPHPDCASVEYHTIEPFIYAPILSLERIENMYNIPKDAIPDEAIVETNDRLVLAEDTETGASASLWGAIKRMFAGKKKRHKYCIVLECYMPANSADYEEYKDSVPVEDDNGKFTYDENNEPVKKEVTRKKKKFASGYKRVTVILNHEDWIIDEADNVYQRPPFFELRNFQQSGDFWGISELQMVEELMMKMNVSASNINDNLRLTGNPKLKVTRDAQESGEDGNEQPITNDPGGIIKSNSPQDIGYISPPSLGFDVKWWLQDFLKSWIDRILHITDALRGFNEYSQDSGRKVQQLRMAAMGSFQTKVDEQAEFLAELYQQWAFIYQNFWDTGSIIQKIEDDFGDAKFEEFNPAEGRDLTLFITVSSASIVPDDPFAKWEEALELYNLGIKRIGTPLISPEQLVDLAPTIDDKTRIKRYLAKEQKKTDQEMQLEAALEQFKPLAEKAAVYGNNLPGSPEEGEITEQLIQMVDQFKQLMDTPEFNAMPKRIKMAIMAGIVLGKEPVEQIAVPQQQPGQYQNQTTQGMVTP